MEKCEIYIKKAMLMIKAVSKENKGNLGEKQNYNSLRRDLLYFETKTKMLLLSNMM